MELIDFSKNYEDEVLEEEYPTLYLELGTNIVVKTVLDNPTVKTRYNKVAYKVAILDVNGNEITYKLPSLAQLNRSMRNAIQVRAKYVSICRETKGSFSQDSMGDSVQAEVTVTLADEKMFHKMWDMQVGMEF